MLPFMDLSGAAILGLMGLRLPQGSAQQKWVYTGLELLVLAVVALTSWQRLRLFAFLYLVVIIRSCLIFQLAGRIVVTLLTFLLFLGVLWARVVVLAPPQM